MNSEKSMRDKLQSLFVHNENKPVRMWRLGNELALAYRGDERVRDYSEFTCLDMLREGSKKSKVLAKVTSYVGPECHYKLSIYLDGIRMAGMVAGMLGFPVLLHFRPNMKNVFAETYHRQMVSANSVCIDVNGHIIVCMMAVDHLRIVGNLDNTAYWTIAEWHIDIPLEDERLFDHFHDKLVRYAEITNTYGCVALRFL